MYTLYNYILNNISNELDIEYVKTLSQNKEQTDILVDGDTPLSLYLKHHDINMDVLKCLSTQHVLMTRDNDFNYPLHIYFNRFHKTNVCEYDVVKILTDKKNDRTNVRLNDPDLGNILNQYLYRYEIIDNDIVNLLIERCDMNDYVLDDYCVETCLTLYVKKSKQINVDILKLLIDEESTWISMALIVFISKNNTYDYDILKLLVEQYIEKYVTGNWYGNGDVSHYNLLQTIHIFYNIQYGDTVSILLKKLITECHHESDLYWYVYYQTDTFDE